MNVSGAVSIPRTRCRAAWGRVATSLEAGRGRSGALGAGWAGLPALVRSRARGAGAFAEWAGPQHLPQLISNGHSLSLCFPLISRTPPPCTCTLVHHLGCTIDSLVVIVRLFHLLQLLFPRKPLVWP